MCARYFISLFLFALLAGVVIAADTSHADDRSFLIREPIRIANAPLSPLLVVLHGGGGDAAGAELMTQLTEISITKGYFVIYPQGSGPGIFGKYFGTWNAGGCCGQAKEKNIDDVGHLRLMIETLITKYPIDKKRVYVTGFSNGAMMAYRLACEASDLIAAIAPVSGQQLLPHCKPKHRIPVFHIHGAKDSCAGFNGGLTGGCFQEVLRTLGLPVKPQNFTAPSVEANIEEWRLRNGCSKKRDLFLEKNAATCIRYTECKNNAEVALCVDKDLGHNWPGGIDPACSLRPQSRFCRAWKPVVGPGSNSIHASEEILRFFERAYESRK